MKKIALVLAAAAALLGGAGLDGQEVTGRKWTLGECIDYALEHSITVRQSENALEQKEIELNTAQNSRLPAERERVGESFFRTRSDGGQHLF